MFMSCRQNAGQNHNMKATNKSFESVSNLKYFGKTVLFRNCIHEECLLPFDSKSFVFPSADFKNMTIKEADPIDRAV